MRSPLRHWWLLLSLSAALGFMPLHAQAPAAQTLKILKVDPPNWWARLPKPMLLVRGEGLAGATFSLSDPALRIEKTVVSENGHWAQIWLAGAPENPETVTLRATHHQNHAAVPYRFAAPRSEGEGMAGFSARDLLYLIMTDRFADGDLNNDGLDAQSAARSADAQAERAKARGWHGGDLRGVLSHLDYLQQLGITAVWLTPVYSNQGEPDSYHGYGATDLYAVDPHFGSLADLQALAHALHARGMKLVLDTVPNHIGPAHPWVTDEPTPVWFHGTAAHHTASETHFRALLDPHAPERDRVGTLQGWFANTLPDMDTDDPVVAQYLRQNAVWWIEQTGADGLRIDTFPYVDRPFWHAFNGELKALFPHLTGVGEIFDGNPEITSAFAGGNTDAGEDTGLYTPFDFPTFFAARDVFSKGAPMSKLADILAEDALYPHPERLVPFLGNHDTSRIAEEVTNPATLRLAYSFLLTTRGMPEIYSGDEIAMRGGGDPDNRHDFPGGFLVNARTAASTLGNAFLAGQRTPEQQDLFAWIAQLAALRRSNAAFGRGSEQVLATNDDWLVSLRDTSVPAETKEAASERLLVALHRGTSAATLEVVLSGTRAEGCHALTPELASKAASAVITADRLSLHLDANDTFIAVCK